MNDTFFRYFRLVRYFYSHNANCAAAIVLSDFSKDGWTMSKSPFDLSIDHILSAGNIELKWSRVFYKLFSIFGIFGIYVIDSFKLN